MTERAATRDLILKTYDARCRGDLDALMACLHPQCSYRLIGAPQAAPLCEETTGHAALRLQMAALIETFVFSDVEVLSLTIEGASAAYHWRARVTFAPTGRSDIFEILDVITVEGGKIRTVAQFTDTAGIQRLVGA